MALRFIDQSRAANFSHARASNAEAAPSPLAAVIRAVAAREAPGRDVADLTAALTQAGFVHSSDLADLDVTDLPDLIPALAACSKGFVVALLSHCQSQTGREHAAQRSGDAHSPRPASTADAGVGTRASEARGGAGAACGSGQSPREQPDARSEEKGRAALIVLGEARRARAAPAPAILAAAVAAAAGCSGPPGAAPTGKPREEVKRPRHDKVAEDNLCLQTLWVEFAGWRRSASQYASAVRLWGEAAKSIRAPGWPPSEAVLDAFVGLFRNGNSLQRYLSHIRSVLYLVQAPLGVISDTQRLARGAEKITSDIFRKEKIRATAEQTRRIRKWCSEAGHPLLGASWAIARQFCLRYSEVLCLGTSAVTFRSSGEGRRTCVIRFARRKAYNEPCETTRRCICHLQGRLLCGVCTLLSLGEEGPAPFAGVQYADALAVLKLAASALQLPSAPAWGTHAFRRGFADEALQHGGPTALFFSGGWKGVAAFGYVSAQSRGALAAAEWLVDHSDSSDGEQP